jgi:hypothetical protein
MSAAGEVQMVQAAQIKEHMDVVGSDGQHVGTVDSVEGSDKIKLTKSDPQSGGQHHFISLSLVDRVDNQVHLSKSAQDVKQQWQSAA